MEVAVLISSFLVRGQRWQLVALVALLFAAGCTVQFQLPPPTVTNLPDGGTVDVLPDSIPAMYSSRPRFYWEQIEQSDSTQSFAVTNGSKDGRWVRGDSMRWIPAGPFITISSDTVATRAYSRLVLDGNGIFSASNDGGTIPTGMNATVTDTLKLAATDIGDGEPMLIFETGGSSLNFPYAAQFSLDPNSTSSFGNGYWFGSWRGTTKVGMYQLPANETYLFGTNSNDLVIDGFLDVTLSPDKLLRLGDNSGGDSLVIDIELGYSSAADSMLIKRSSSNRIHTIALSDVVSAGGGGTMSSFSLAADSGSPETVSDAETVTNTGGYGINTSIAATNTTTIGADTSELSTLYRAQREAGLYILHAEDFYTSDWAAAINTAIDSLTGLGGGTVILPPDTLSLNRQTTIGTNDYCILLKDNVQLTGHGLSTVLQLANTQITDTYPTTHIIHGVELKNSSVSNLQIIGNTAGQSSYTGGYQQSYSAGTGIYLKPGAAAARGKNFILRNVKIYDTFGAGAALQYTDNIHIENVEVRDGGELIEIGWSDNAIADNVYCNTTYAGDGIEFSNTENMQLSNFIVENATFGSGVDVYGVTEGQVSNGLIKNCDVGLNIHHTGTEPPPSGFMDSIFNLVVSDVIAIDNTTYGLDMRCENLTNTTINNYISKNNTQGGLIAGYSTGYGSNWNAKFYDCDFSENTGPGAFIYDPILIEFFNCSFNGNGGNGISHEGPKLITSDQDSVGTLNVWGGQIRNNTTNAIAVANSSVKPVGTIEAYMEGNNSATAGASVNRNIRNDAANSEFFKIRNLRPQMDGPAFSTLYVHGEKRVNISTNTSQLFSELEDNQVIELYADASIGLVNGYDDFDIRTISGIDKSLVQGDLITVVFRADSVGWYEIAPGGDDLGNHTATQNIQLQGNYLSNDGGNEGVYIDNNGNVSIGKASPGYRLDVQSVGGYTARFGDGTNTMLHYAQGMLGSGSMNIGTASKGSSFQIANGTENFALVLSGSTSGGQRLAINDSSPDFSLDIETTDAIKPPKGTDAQRPGSPIDGIFRWNTTNNNMEVYYGGIWYTMNRSISATGTLDFASTSAQSSADLTITLTGATAGDIVSLAVPTASINANTSYSAWVSASNTVTVRFNNYSSGAVDPASGVFRVSVDKY